MVDKKQIFTLYSKESGKFFAGVQWFPLWTRNKNDAYWMPTKERAESINEKFFFGECEVMEFTAIYPDGRVPYIRP